MKITSLPQNNYHSKTSFKGAESAAAKYSDEIMNAITSSIHENFTNSVLPEVKKKQSRIGKAVGDFIESKPVLKSLNNTKRAAGEFATGKIADFVGWLSDKKVPRFCVEQLSRFKKPSARMADLASVTITYFYVRNNFKSKKIEEERKLPLAVNNVAVTVVSSTMAALIDKLSDVVLDKVKLAFNNQKGAEVLENVMKKAPETAKFNEDQLKDLAKTILENKEFKKGLKDYSKRFEKAKSLTIFSFVVRFLVTVLMVPVAGKLVEIIKEKYVNKAPDAKEQVKKENNK